MSDIALLSLGTVLIDHFKYLNSDGDPEREERHVGGGGLFAVGGARIWLPSARVRIPVSGRENPELKVALDKLSMDDEMWLWDDEDTLEALIEYRGDERRRVSSLFFYLYARHTFLIIHHTASVMSTRVHRECSRLCHKVSHRTLSACTSAAVQMFSPRT